MHAVMALKKVTDVFESMPHHRQSFDSHTEGESLPGPVLDF